MVVTMSKSEYRQCPICRTFNGKNTTVSLLPELDALEFSCVRCGTYQVTRALSLTPAIPDDLRPFLSIAARQSHERGQLVRFDVIES